MKYPFVLFYRDDSNAFIDDFFHKNNKLLQCTMHIINKKEKINKIYNTNYQLLVIFDKDKSQIVAKNIKQQYNISDTVLLRKILKLLIGILMKNISIFAGYPELLQDLFFLFLHPHLIHMTK